MPVPWKIPQITILLPLIILLVVSISFVEGKKGIAQSVTTEKKALLWSNSFDTKDWMSQWHVREKGKRRLGDVEIINDPSEKFNNTLRVYYKKGSLDPANKKRPKGGTSFHAGLGISPSDDLYLRYYVRFPDDFSFAKGGKLPGLFGGRAISGGHDPNGTNGFSTRFMWRENGEGEIYVYLPTSEGYGTEFGKGNWRFTPGIWHSLEQHVVLNTIGKKDGSIQAWFDKKLVLEEKNVYFRSVDSLKIEGIFFSTFFGGHDSSWADPKDTYIDFADFAVSNAPITKP